MSRRIRSLKPEILEDEKTAGLSDTAFRLFIGLITMADDYGTFRSEARFVEKNVYWLAVPERPVATALLELEKTGMVSFYVVRGQKYGRFTNWPKHQRVDNARKEAALPGPDQADEFAATRGEPPQLAAGLDGIGEDRKGEDLTPAREAPPEPRSETKLKSVPPGPPSGYDLAKRVWEELWRAKYKRPYEKTGQWFGPHSEDQVLVRVGDLALERGAEAEKYLRHKITGYLKDQGNNRYLVEHCHPLRTLERDWVKYGEPKANAAPRKAKEASEPPLSIEEIRKRAEGVRELEAGIGRGGTG